MDAVDIIRGYDAAENIVYKAKTDLAFHGAQEKAGRIHDYIVKQSKQAFAAWDEAQRLEALNLELADDPRHDGIDGHCYEGCPCLAEKAAL